MSFLVLFALIILLVGFSIVRTRAKAFSLSALTWEELVDRLQPLPAGGISTVALDYLQPSKGQIQLATDELWLMVGGDEGIQRMYANAQILIALAGYAQRWNFEESVIVAERMRRDGVILRRATLRLSLGIAMGRIDVRGPFNAQEAASAYYLMKQRLLALYETSHAARYPQLAALL